MGNLSNLKVLYLGLNDLTGEVPAVLAELPNLEDLILPRNKLTGEIPPELGNLAKPEAPDSQRKPLNRGDTAGAE